MYNISYRTALKETPFKIVYYRDPPIILSYEAVDTKVAVVAARLHVMNSWPTSAADLNMHIWWPRRHTIVAIGPCAIFCW